MPLSKYRLTTICGLVSCAAALFFYYPSGNIEAPSNQPSNSGLDLVSREQQPDQAQTRSITPVQPPTPQSSSSELLGIVFNEDEDLSPTLLGDSLSTFPDEPATVYKTNIGAALQGDAQAMYYVWKALYSCRGFRPGMSRQELVAMTMGISAFDFKKYEAADTLCQQLWSQIDEPERSNELRKKWLHEAADNGFKTAHLQIMMNANLDSSFQFGALEKFVTVALYEEGADAFLHASDIVAYSDASETTKMAWEYLSCSQNKACSTSFYEKVLISSLQLYEVGAVIEMADGLRASIEKQSLEDGWTRGTQVPTP